MSLALAVKLAPLGDMDALIKAALPPPLPPRAKKAPTSKQLQQRARNTGKGAAVAAGTPGALPPPLAAALFPLGPWVVVVAWPLCAGAVLLLLWTGA